MSSEEPEKPTLLVRAIAFVESSSYYKDGKWVAVNAKTSKAGAVGIFQLTKIACKDVKADYRRCKWDHDYAQKTCEAYLQKLAIYCDTTDYIIIAGAYNAGPRKCNIHYVRRITEAMRNLLP